MSESPTVKAHTASSQQILQLKTDFDKAVPIAAKCTTDAAKVEEQVGVCKCQATVTAMNEALAPLGGRVKTMNEAAPGSVTEDRYKNLRTDLTAAMALVTKAFNALKQELANAGKPAAKVDIGASRLSDKDATGMVNFLKKMQAGTIGGEVGKAKVKVLPADSNHPDAPRWTIGSASGSIPTASHNAKNLPNAKKDMIKALSAIGFT
jgi:hypothetical protein